MSFDRTPVQPAGPAVNVIRPPRRGPTPVADGFAEALGGAGEPDGLPASPPAEALRHVQAAAVRYEWLQENGRELRFSVDPYTRRVRIEVRDLDGRLLRGIPLSQALDAISGGPFE